MTTATERLGGYEFTEGDRVWVARNRRNLSQAELAKLVRCY